MAAMAEALRANAEALHRIDQSQKKIAETMARSERSQQVVTSTRALNDTFRGLSEIQRGLLDAVVRNRGGGAATLVLVLVVAVLSGGIGLLASEHFLSGDKVGRDVLEESRREADALSREAIDLKAQLREGAERERAWSERIDGKNKEIAAAAGESAKLEERIAQLEADLEANRAQLEEYLVVKQRADQAGELMQANMILSRDNRTLKDKVAQLEEERRKLYSWMGDRVLEMRGGDREAILDTARKLGLYEEPEPPAPEGGPIPLSKRAERKIIQQLDRLMPDGDSYLRVLKIGAIEKGRILHEVTFGRYKGGRLVGSLACKTLTIHADPETDTVELRLKDGHITSTARQGEKIPIGVDGHSEFLQEAGLADWLRREGADVEVGPEGMLTWKTTPP
jgi:hypothetical protein